MQKVIRRTILAEKQVARRTAKRWDKKRRDVRANNLEQARFHRRDEIDQIKKMRKAQREDWELGPLRPKRDVGDQKESWGTLNSLRAQGPVLTQTTAWEKQIEFAGRMGRELIQVGDRVAILEGRDRGKIGQISHMDFDRAECKVEGLNMVDIKVPEWMLANEQEENKVRIRTVEKPMPFSWIRLVVKLTNPDTGAREDYVCEKVHRNGGRRYVTMPDGSEVNIPLKKKTSGGGRETPADTLRMEVEQKSFVPTLLRPPMPGSVIDELRNKYSIFRTRHDPEYIVAKIKEDEEKEEKKKLIKKMRTPLNEINRLERKMKKAKGKGKLTDKMLERIGEVITAKRQLQLQLDASGISKQPEVVAA